jgi:tetratricopeptide (TPR) repeat protein
MPAPPTPDPTPATPAEWVAFAVRLRREERNFSALAALDQALALDAAFEPALMARALLLEDLDRYEDALAAYETLLTAQPTHVAAASNRAGLLLRLERFPEALASLDQALAADPQNDLLALNKGLLLWQAFDAAAAARPWLERAAAAGFPEAARALSEMGGLTPHP